MVSYIVQLVYDMQQWLYILSICPGYIILHVQPTHGKPTIKQLKWYEVRNKWLCNFVVLYDNTVVVMYSACAYYACMHF